MSVVITVLLTVLVFGVLIFVHELGHFLAAKWAGIRVLEFALGMGPAIFKKQGKETLYTIRAFPIGGFCSMEGEDEENEPDNPRSYMNAKPYKRLIVAVAGAFMNFVLGFVIIICLTAPNETLGTRTIAQFKDDAVSSSYGLQVNDQIVKVDGVAATIDRDVAFLMLRAQSGTIDLEVMRDGERVLLPGVEFRTEDAGDGMIALDIDFYVYSTPNTFLKTLEYSIKYTWVVVKQVALSLYDLVRGHVPMSQLSGPVGVASVIGEAAGISFESLLSIVIVITINLGFMNLLPLPALDGGRIIFILIEMIRRKPVNPKWEGYIHAAGFVLLIILIILVTFKDIVGLFT